MGERPVPPQPDLEAISRQLISMVMLEYFKLGYEVEPLDLPSCILVIGNGGIARLKMRNPHLPLGTVASSINREVVLDFSRARTVEYFDMSGIKPGVTMNELLSEFEQDGLGNGEYLVLVSDEDTWNTIKGTAKPGRQTDTIQILRYLVNGRQGQQVVEAWVSPISGTKSSYVEIDGMSVNVAQLDPVNHDDEHLLDGVDIDLD